MLEPATLTPLGHQILEHWKRHRPTMVGNLERDNHFQQAIFAAQELTGNLLYELTVVQKMDYQPAGEIATREWALGVRHRSGRSLGFLFCGAFLSV